MGLNTGVIKTMINPYDVLTSDLIRSVNLEWLFNAGYFAVGALGTNYLLNLRQDKFSKCFNNCNLVNKDKEEPELITKEKKENGVLYQFKIPAGLSLDDFKNKKEELEHFLQSELKLWSSDDVLKLRTYQGRLPEKVNFTEQIINYLNNQKLTLSLGYSKRGYQVINLTDVYNLLIAGPVGSGKSCLIRQMIVSAILKYTPAKLGINFIDLKGGLEVNALAGADHLECIAETQGQALQLVQGLNDELDRRMKKVKKAGVTNIHFINTQFKYKLLVIDEFAEIKDKEIIEKVNRLLRLARFAGIYVIIATQRPTVKVIPGNLKANIPGRISFKMPSKTDSQTILDVSDAYNLAGLPGRCIYKLGESIKCQAPYISENKTKELINNVK